MCFVSVSVCVCEFMCDSVKKARVSLARAAFCYIARPVIQVRLLDDLLYEEHEAVTKR